MERVAARERRALNVFFMKLMFTHVVLHRLGSFAIFTHMAKSSRIASFVAATCLSLSTAAGLAGAADSGTAPETLQPLPTVEVPATGSSGSSSRVPKACQNLNQQIDEVRKKWDAAVAEQDIYKANALRVDFGNLAASYYQCRLAGNTISGSL